MSSCQGNIRINLNSAYLFKSNSLYSSSKITKPHAPLVSTSINALCQTRCDKASWTLLEESNLSETTHKPEEGRWPK